jgi:bacterioferritin-associated ferredoxin
VEGGTVRHYAEILRDLGFPMGQDPETGAYLWSPELVEVARAAYSMAKATKGLSFREAVELILYAGELAGHAKEGRSIVTLLREVLRLPVRLEQAVADVRGAVDELRSVDRNIRRDVQQVISEYQEVLAESAIGAVIEVGKVAGEAREVLREASSGGWVAPVAMVLVAMGLVLPLLVKGGLAAVGPYLVMLGVGAFLGWWVRG